MIKKTLIHTFLLALFLSITLPAHNAVGRDVSMLRAVKFDPFDPLNISFYFDRGSEDEVGRIRAVEYFLAALALPEEKIWVNLSPDEKDRIIDDSIAGTKIAGTLLEQDCELKKYAAGLTDPDTPTGRAYWERFGTLGSGVSSGPNPAIETGGFNKIWITPESAEIFDGGNYAIVTDASLTVSTGNTGQHIGGLLSRIAGTVKCEVNIGERFSELRQLYNSLVLASWFKRKFRTTVYSQYIDSARLGELANGSEVNKDTVFDEYVKNFKEGAYRSYRKERAADGRCYKKLYISGGIAYSSSALIIHNNSDKIPAGSASGMDRLDVRLKVTKNYSKKTYPENIHILINEIPHLKNKYFLGYRDDVTQWCDKNSGWIYYVKASYEDLSYEKFGYNLAKIIGMYAPPMRSGHLSNGQSYIFTQSVESMTDEQLAGRKTGVEELLVFMAVTQTDDFRLGNNVVLRGTGKDKKLLVFDLSVAREDVPVSFDLALMREMAEDIDVLYLFDVLDRTVESLPYDKIFDMAIESGIPADSLDPFVTKIDNACDNVDDFFLLAIARLVNKTRREEDESLRAKIDEMYSRFHEGKSKRDVAERYMAFMEKYFGSSAVVASNGGVEFSSLPLTEVEPFSCPYLETIQNITFIGGYSVAAPARDQNISDESK